MKIIVNSKQMKQCDKNTIEKFGIHGQVLMERAALKVVQILREEKLDVSFTLIVCGTGNNGGDGFAIARLLHLSGETVTVVCIGQKENLSIQARAQYESLEAYGVEILKTIPQKCYSLVIDALFGIGLARNLEGIFFHTVEQVNRLKGYKVAVDIPSGICADNGFVMGTAIKSDLTVTFAYNKIGNILYPGAGFAGRTVVADIGITEESFLDKSPRIFSFEKEDLALLPERKPDGNKGTFGKVLVIAGSEDMIGAGVFSAKAALVSGCGMVKIFTCKNNKAVMASLLPEVLLSGYEPDNFREEILKEQMEWADSIVIGPGMGTGAVSGEIVERVLKNAKVPLVIDADALNLISENPKWLEAEHKEWIITPHVGEMSRLCNKNISYITSHLIQAAEEFARKFHVVCVLKDARTIIAVPFGDTYINQTGNDGMATAGSGDVLSGLIGGLVAAGCCAETAAGLGVMCHGMAGDRCKDTHGKRGMLASDIIQSLKDVIK